MRWCLHILGSAVLDTAKFIFLFSNPDVGGGPLQVILEHLLLRRLAYRWIFSVELLVCIRHNDNWLPLI